MRKITRAAMIVFALATCVGTGLLATLWFSWDPLLPFAIWLARMGWFDAALLVLLSVTALGVAAMLVAAIAAPGRGAQLSLEQEGGHVAITKEAISSTATRTIESHRGMTCKSTRVDIRGRRNPRIRIRAKVDPSSNVGLTTLGTAMQREVAESVGALAGYPVESVDITFTSTSGASMAARDAHAAPHPARMTTLTTA
ncbi:MULTISPECIES: alkaline shock response membrane anchor protein AmaP [unclassified Adlercreutzia]|uniref:alkaline shock response membrane anchor protein AmaP n=1 Tax=unclassified Adlercreutzia TaxID=2636013 RepID=UPI0013ED7079|nr:MULTISPECIES: alkaline shock response membrane anchor protein AmaP [unclassified Adlercreutzia]